MFLTGKPRSLSGELHCPLVEDEAKAINVRQSPSVNPDVEKLRGRFVLRK